MKSVLAIIASMSLSLLAGCAAPVGPETTADEPTIEAQDSGEEVLTTYYSDATHTTEVGHCVLTTCPNQVKGTTCYGTKTAYYTTDIEPCF